MDSLETKIALVKANIASVEARMAEMEDGNMKAVLGITLKYLKQGLEKDEASLASLHEDDEPLTAEERAELAYQEERRAKKEEKRVLTKGGEKVYDTNGADMYMVTEEVGDKEERVIAYCASRNMARTIVKTLVDFAGRVIQSGHEGAIHLYERTDIIHRGYISDGTYHETAYQRVY